MHKILKKGGNRENMNTSTQNKKNYKTIINQYYKKAVEREYLDSIEVDRANNDVSAVIFYDDCKIVIPFDELDANIPPKLKNQPLSLDTKIESATRLMGSKLPFIVESFDKNTSIVKASRKKALDILRNSKDYKVGDTVKAQVIDITNSFAFAEFDGYIGLIQIRDVAPTRVFNIKDYLNKGNEYEFKILNMNPDKKSCDLCSKVLCISPFKEFVIEKKMYKKNSIYAGTVKFANENFFMVELRKGLNIAVNYPVTRDVEIFVGKEVVVRINRIQENKERLSGQLLSD